jgi:hypothetical protein
MNDQGDAVFISLLLATWGLGKFNHSQIANKQVELARCLAAVATLIAPPRGHPFYFRPINMPHKADLV